MPGLGGMRRALSIRCGRNESGHTGTATSRGGSIHLQQFDIEHQRGVGRDDAAGAAGAIAELGRDDQGALAADLHAGHALVPALDHLMRAEWERKRLAAVEGAVELLALLAIVVEPAGVMHADILAGGRLGAGAARALGVL